MIPKTNNFLSGNHLILKENDLPDTMEELETRTDEQLEDSDVDNVNIISKILPGTLSGD